MRRAVAAWLAATACTGCRDAGPGGPAGRYKTELQKRLLWFSAEARVGCFQPSLVVGGLMITQFAGVTALDAETGRLRWRTPSTDRQCGDAVTCGDLVAHVGSETQVLEVATGRERWKAPSPGIPGLVHAGACDGTTIYVSGQDDEVRAMDLATGATRWEVQADTSRDPLTSIRELYVERDTLWVAGGRRPGWLAALDAKTGALLREQEYPRSYFLSLRALPDLFVFSHSTGILAIDRRTWAQVWRFDGTGEQLASPTHPVFVRGDTVFYTDAGGYAFALNLRTGARLWVDRAAGFASALCGSLLYSSFLDLSANDAATGRRVTSESPEMVHGQPRSIPKTNLESFSSSGVGTDGRRVYVLSESLGPTPNPFDGAYAFRCD